MSGIWLLAGPPFGAELFRAALPRLVASRPNDQVTALSVVELADGAGWQASAAKLASRVSPGDVVVAHGLAVPVAIAVEALVAAKGSPLGALALANGPLRRLDPVSAAVARLARIPGAAQTVFRPGPWLAWLRSSAGLRRAVNNPYAMDRDTVAALCGTLVADAGRRGALVAWLASLSEAWPSAASSTAPLTLLWGDNDALHPLGEADMIGVVRGAGVIRVAPGGRFVWPEEMPWAFADEVAALGIPAAHAAPRSSDEGAQAPPNGPATTPMSRKAKPRAAPGARNSAKIKVGA